MDDVSLVHNREVKIVENDDFDYVIVIRSNVKMSEIGELDQLKV